MDCDNLIVPHPQTPDAHTHAAEEVVEEEELASGNVRAKMCIPFLLNPSGGCSDYPFYLTPIIHDTPRPRSDSTETPSRASGWKEGAVAEETPPQTSAEMAVWDPAPADGFRLVNEGGAVVQAAITMLEEQTLVVQQAIRRGHPFPAHQVLSDQARKPSPSFAVVPHFPPNFSTLVFPYPCYMGAGRCLRSP